MLNSFAKKRVKQERGSDSRACSAHEEYRIPITHHQHPGNYRDEPLSCRTHHILHCGGGASVAFRKLVHQQAINAGATHELKAGEGQIKGNRR